MTRWWQLFIRYRHIHYYSVYHTRRDMLFYLPKSTYPGLFHPVRGIPMSVGRTQLYFWFFIRLHYAGLLPASLYTHLIATAFWLVTQELPYFSENRRTALPPHWRWQIRSRVLPDQAR